MAKYELPDHVVKNITAIVDDATIKGSMAPAIVEIKHILANPIKEPKEEKKVQN